MKCKVLHPLIGSTNEVYLEMASAYGNYENPKDVTVDIEKAKRKAIVLWNSKYRLHIYLSMEDKLSDKVPMCGVFGEDNEF